MASTRVRGRRRASAQRSGWSPFLRGAVVGAIIILVAVLALTQFGSVHRVVRAATSFTVENIGGQIGLGSTDLKRTIVNILRWALGILALTAVSFVVYGGFLWMTARGDEKRIEKAKKVIASAVIGLIIVLLSWAIVHFVIGTAVNVTNNEGAGDGGPPDICVGLGCSREFAIRAITTACGDPSQPYKDVYRCSSVAITFNQRVDADSVSTAVAAAGDDQLIIEKCNDDLCTALAAPPTPAPIDNQVYSGARPVGTKAAPKAEWVVPVIRDKTSNGIVFYHKYRLFEENTTYRLRIPKTIRAAGGKLLAECKKADGGDLPGDCTDAGHDKYFTWRFKVGVKDDTAPPAVTSTIPSSKYKVDSNQKPDRDVSRKPTLVIRFSEAIDQGSIRQAEADPKDNSLVLYEMTRAPDDPDKGTGGAWGAPMDPAKFTVLPGEDNKSLLVQLNGGEENYLKPYTWYRVEVKKIEDQCQNVMADYDFVFETNNVTPKVAEVYPDNGYEFACPDIDVEIRYSVSMYDIENHGCLVGMPPAANIGFVTGGQLKKEAGPDAGRTLNVVDIIRGPDDDPNKRCKRYAFLPPDTLLAVDQWYTAGVTTRFKLNDQGKTLNYGDPAITGDPDSPPWRFKTKPPDKCANAPRIVKLDPPNGPKGQCFTVQGKGFGSVKRPADKLTFGGEEISTDSWSDRNIVTTAPTNKPVSPPPYDVQVTVDHPAPIGPLASRVTDDSRFTIDPGDASNGPCLLSVDPDQGEVNDYADLRGKRFINDPIRKVLFDGYPIADADGDFSIPSDAAHWTNAFAPDAHFIPGTNVGIGDIRVKNSKGASNALSFEVLPTIPGRPRVSRYWPKLCSDGVCVNAAIGARFSEKMNPGSFTLNSLELRKCGVTCDRADLGGQLLTAVPTYTESGDKYELDFDAHPDLEPNAQYRVIIVGDAGVQSLTGQALRQADWIYDRDGVGGNDSFSWTFKVKNDATLCSVSSVSMSPIGPTTLRIGRTLTAKATPRGSPDSCDDSGQRLDGTKYDWAWSVIDPDAPPDNVEFILPWDKNGDGRNDPAQQVRGLDPTPGATVRATEADSGKFAETVVKVSEDLAFCNKDDECLTNEDGATCDSICHNNRCTPVINTYSPANATPDSLVTVTGCWFGRYVDGTSKMTFLGPPAMDGTTPPDMCGRDEGTWHNTFVIRGVPAGAASGPLQLTRGDSRTDVTNGPTNPPTVPPAGANPMLANFTVDVGAPGPGICKIDPKAERIGRPVTVIGSHFGPVRGAGDKVTFTNNKDVDVLDYAWADSQIGVKVPTDAETGPVRAISGGKLSNDYPFRVIGGASGEACAASCSDDSECAALPGTACSPRGCCSPWPFVDDKSPDGVNVCRNVGVKVRFGGASIDAGTVNATSVLFTRVADGSTVEAKIELSGSTLRIVPKAALEKNTVFRVVLKNTIRSKAGIKLGALTTDTDGDSVLDAYQWEFTTGNEICKIERVVVDPSSYTFYKIDGEGPESSHDFIASARGRDNVELIPVPSYIWNWEWAISNESVIKIKVIHMDPRVVTPTAIANGQTLLTAKAVLEAPNSGTKSGSASIRVLHCDNTWGPIDPATGTFVDKQNNCTLNPASCDSYNFSTTYCRDQNGPTPLPDLNKMFIRGSVGDRLKEFFFTEPGLGPRDAVGIIVFDNSEGLSPQEWLNQNMSGQGSGGQPSVFQGYPAYRLGTSLYVAATNFTSTRNVCTDLMVTEGRNGNFENWTGGVPDRWTPSGGFTPEQMTAAANPEYIPPGGLNSSVLIDASTLPEAGPQRFLFQNVTNKSVDDRHFRITGYVRVEKDKHFPGKRAGLITQCDPPSDCFSVDGSYDLHAGAPGLYTSNATASVPLPWKPSWKKIDITVTNRARVNAGLRLNCFAEPSWKVWCDNITVTEINACAAGDLRQNLYVMSVNEEAQPATREVFSRLVSNWELNINPELSDEDRKAMARDSARWNDLAIIKKKLTEYRARTGGYPELAGGTFTPNVSTSVWGSWNSTLGNALGATLPSDPVNKFDPPCDPAGGTVDPNTCWSVAEKKFSCPINSHLYGYRFYYGGCTSSSKACGNDADCPDEEVCLGGACTTARTKCAKDADCSIGERCSNPAPAYALAANLEYAGPASPRVDPPINLCEGLDPSNCSCFTHAVRP